MDLPIIAGCRAIFCVAGHPQDGAIVRVNRTGSIALWCFGCARFGFYWWCSSLGGPIGGTLGVEWVLTQDGVACECYLRRLPDLDEPAERVEAAPLPAFQPEWHNATAEAIVSQVFPNWRAMVRTEEFAKWARQQAPGVIQLAESRSPRDAIAMLILFCWRHVTDVPAR